MIRFAIGIWVALAGMALTAAPATTAASSAPAAGAVHASSLAIVAQRGLELYSPSFARVDIAEVAASHVKAVTYAFAVKDVGTLPVTIVSLAPSCKCASAQIMAAGGAQELPCVVQPGHAARIVVTVNVAILKPGPIDKFLAIRTSGAAWPAATIEIEGVVHRK